MSLDIFTLLIINIKTHQRNNVLAEAEKQQYEKHKMAKKIITPNTNTNTHTHTQTHTHTHTQTPPIPPPHTHIHIHTHLHIQTKSELIYFTATYNGLNDPEKQEMLQNV